MLLAVGVCLLIVGDSLLRYPAILLPLRTGLSFLIMSLVILLAYALAAWSLTRSTHPLLHTMFQDSQNKLQFQESGAPDLVTFIVGDSLAGAIGHLIIGLLL